jgi:hypothetical protein
MPGFLGTGARFSADLNLVVQLAMGLALVVGAAFAPMQAVPPARRLSKHRLAAERRHDRGGNVAFVSRTGRPSVGAASEAAVLLRSRRSWCAGDCGRVAWLVYRSDCRNAVGAAPFPVSELEGSDASRADSLGRSLL